MSEKPKPCLWCKKGTTFAAIKFGVKNYHQVLCCVCDAAGPGSMSKEQAIAFWNHRPWEGELLEVKAILEAARSERDSYLKEIEALKEENKRLLDGRRLKELQEAMAKERQEHVKRHNELVREIGELRKS